MSLTPGTRLGPYEIQSALGAGGMGVVYRARDTRLDRTVAIQVLPEMLAADPQFRERFDREARTLATLSHSHICQVFDVGRHESTDFLVMEYLEGETLEHRLRRPEGLRLPGEIPLRSPGESALRSPGEGGGGQPGEGSRRPSGLRIDEALQIAIQIADALAAALIDRRAGPGWRSSRSWCPGD